MRIEERLSSDLEELRKKGFNHEFSPIIKTPDEAKKFSPIYIDMVEDAIILYDRDSFFSKILERLRTKMRELGSRRIWMGKAWVWDLKPDAKIGEVFSLE